MTLRLNVRRHGIDFETKDAALSVGVVAPVPRSVSASRDTVVVRREGRSDRQLERERQQREEAESALFEPEGVPDELAQEHNPRERALTRETTELAESIAVSSVSAEDDEWAALSATAVIV